MEAACLSSQDNNENFGGINFQANSLSINLKDICNSTLAISSEPCGNGI